LEKTNLALGGAEWGGKSEERRHRENAINYGAAGKDSNSLKNARKKENLKEGLNNGRRKGTIREKAQTNDSISWKLIRKILRRAVSARLGHQGR